MKLLDETLRLLETTPVPVAQIARDIGCSERWLHKLKKGQFVDPGVNRIEGLYHYLTRQQKAA